MKVTGMIKEFILGEDRPFQSSHASTLLPLKDGGVLAAWFGGSWEKSPDVAIWTSKRAGDTWRKPKIAVDHRGIACWNPVLFRGADDRILLFYKVGETIEGWKTYVAESFDEGESFSEPEELVKGDAGGRGPVKNKPIRLKDGAVLAPASLEGTVWDCFTDRSEDDCRTWESSPVVPLRRVIANGETLNSPYSRYHCYGKGIIQPALWQDEAGEVHMLTRSTSSRIFRSDSKDGGRTWSLAYDTGLPNNNSGIDLAKLPDGRLILALNPRENAPGYYKGGRTPLSLYCSEDNGVHFQELIRLEDGNGSFAYPAVVPGNDGEILITYTWNRVNICFCRITYEV